MTKKRTAAAVGLGAILCASMLNMGATDAKARISAGDISLKVTGKCPALGDSIKSFTVWTPEKGTKKIVSGKSGTINFGTFRKTVRGDTYFNWTLDCTYSGRSGSHQKRYGGNAVQTSYNFTIENKYGRLKYP